MSMGMSCVLSPSLTTTVNVILPPSSVCSGLMMAMFTRPAALFCRAREGGKCTPYRRNVHGWRWRQRAAPLDVFAALGGDLNQIVMERDEVVRLKGVDD